MEDPSRPDFLVFGDYFCDLIITGLPELPRLGADITGTGMGMEAGGAFNLVRALQRLGACVLWSSQLGNDLFSQFVLGEAHREGVDTSLLRIVDHPVRRFSLSFSYTHERGFISYIDPLEESDRLGLVRQIRPRCVLLDGVEYGQSLLELTETAHAVGAILAMDCQSGPETLQTPGLIEALRAVDIFLPNLGEARQLTGKADTLEVARELAGYTPLLVLKQGDQGALAIRDEEVVFAPAIPARVVDTTGAGDCFNAGFLFHYLQGSDLLTCLRFGNICGGLSTQTHGTCGTPTLAEAEKVFHEQYPGH